MKRSWWLCRSLADTPDYDLWTNNTCTLCTFERGWHGTKQIRILFELQSSNTTLHVHYRSSLPLVDVPYAVRLLMSFWGVVQCCDYNILELFWKCNGMSLSDMQACVYNNPPPPQGQTCAIQYDTNHVLAIGFIEKGGIFVGTYTIPVDEVWQR